MSRRIQQRRQKQQKKKELNWSKLRDKYWDDKVQLEIERYRTLLQNQYGFLADPNLTAWENLDAYYDGLDPYTYAYGRPSNMACHNLCIKTNTSVGIERLLGLGAKFCVKKSKLICRQANGKLEGWQAH